MLQILLESDARLPRPARAAVFSLALHSTIIGTFVLTRPGGDAGVGPETRQDVRYLIPFDRVKAPRPEQVPTPWLALGRVGEGTGFETRLVDKDLLTGPPAPGRTRVAADKKLTATAAELAVFDTVATAVDVDSATRVLESAAPAYPPLLLATNVEGATLFQFVVDTTGRIDSTTVLVVSATHREFVDAVRVVLPRMRFSPAVVGSRKVRQLVQQPFKFKIVSAETQSAANPP